MLRTRKGPEPGYLELFYWPIDSSPWMRWMMKDRRLEVELVGLFPEFYTWCAKCQVFDYLKIARLDYVSEQVSGYPKEVLRQQEKLKEIYAGLVKDFGSSVRPIFVGLLSFRGLWLSLRYRLFRGLSVIIDGRRVLSGDLPYEAIRSAVEEELAHARSYRGGSI